MPDQPQPMDTGVSDADLFSSAMENPAPASDTGGQSAQEQPPIQQQQPDQQPSQDGGPARDERGRFAAKDGEPPPAQQAPPAADGQQQPPADGQQRPADDGAAVPSWRLREEREAREAAHARAEQAERRALQTQMRLEQLERHLQQKQNPPEPIDPLADPQGFLAMMREEFERGRMEDRLQFSMERAHEKHGEVFEQAYNAFCATAPGNQQWAQSVLRRPNPGAEIVAWYNKERAYQEFGTDPKAYRSKLLEDPQFLAEAVAAANARATGQVNGARPNNVTQRPVSLSRVPGGGPNPVDDNDVSDRALFRHATAR